MQRDLPRSMAGPLPRGKTFRLVCAATRRVPKRSERGAWRAPGSVTSESTGTASSDPLAVCRWGPSPWRDHMSLCRLHTPAPGNAANRAAYPCAVELLHRALEAIDAANAQDPTVVTVRDRTGPKEIVHAELVTGWVRQLVARPDDALLLAARGHHFRRWTSPRASAPAGRAGYLRWRKALHEQHARELGAVLAEVGYDPPAI